MKIISKLISISLITFLVSACINTSSSTGQLTDKVMKQFVSGVEVNTGYQPLQKLNDSFEATSDDGPILNQTIEVFELSNGECLSLVTLHNESGFGGYEDLLIFRGNELLTVLQRNLIFSREDGSTTKDSIRYDDVVDDSERTQLILKEDFSRYKKQFNSKVLSTCK